jgi:hypothetical protein
MRYFYDIQGVLEWVQDSMKKGNRELQEKLMLLQKEKDQDAVIVVIMYVDYFQNGRYCFICIKRHNVTCDIILTNIS